MMCLMGKLWEKLWKKIFLPSLNKLDLDKLDLELDPYPDSLVRDTDPGILIRTKISRIPNTAFSASSATPSIRHVHGHRC